MELPGRSLQIRDFSEAELIRQVQMRPGVWNHKLKSYMNRGNRMLLWDEIGSVFGHANGALCRSHWDKLKKSRAQSNRRQKKSQTSGSGGASRPKKYIYDELMSFMQVTETGRSKSICNLATVPEEDLDEAGNVDDPAAACEAAWESSMLMPSSGGTTFRPIPTVASPNASRIQVLDTASVNGSIAFALQMNCTNENMGAVPRSSTPLSDLNVSQVSSVLGRVDNRRPLGLLQETAAEAAASTHGSPSHGQNHSTADRRVLESARERRDRERAALQSRRERERNRMRQEMEERVNLWRDNEARREQNAANNVRPNAAPQRLQGGEARQNAGHRRDANWIDLAVLDEVRGLRAMDESSHLGMYIASRLRKLPPSHQNSLTMKILEAIQNEEQLVSNG